MYGQSSNQVCEVPVSVVGADGGSEAMSSLQNGGMDDSERSRVSRPYGSRWTLDDMLTAHRIMQNALRRGTLVRYPCEVCGDPKSEGHHDNYDQPLDIKWLCRTHHAARHRLVGKLVNYNIQRNSEVCALKICFRCGAEWDHYEKGSAIRCAKCKSPYGNRLKDEKKEPTK